MHTVRFATPTSALIIGYTAIFLLVFPFLVKIFIASIKCLVIVATPIPFPVRVRVQVNVILIISLVLIYQRIPRIFAYSMV